jgi:hypothetical protein
LHRKGNGRSLYFPNGEMARGIFYLLLALCVVGTLRFVLAIRTRIRRRQHSRRIEAGIAKYLSQMAAKNNEQAGTTSNG